MSLEHGRRHSLNGTCQQQQCHPKSLSPWRACSSRPHSGVFCLHSSHEDRTCAFHFGADFQESKPGGSCSIKACSISPWSLSPGSLAAVLELFLPNSPLRRPSLLLVCPSNILFFPFAMCMYLFKKKNR